MNGQNNPLVLVADDEDRFRRSQVEALNFFGYDVEEARNGKELYSKAESLIKSGKVFVLTVDNQMPEGSGENEREKQWCGFEHILDLLDGVVIAAQEQQVHAILTLEHGVERIQFHGSLYLNHRLTRTVHDEQKKRIISTNIRIVGIELDSPLEGFFRRLPVPLPVMEGSQTS